MKKIANRTPAGKYMPILFSKKVSTELSFIVMDCRVYQNATAPVKGEKVSLKIQRADLIADNCLSDRLFFCDMPAILFPFSLDGFGGF
jgi:hypothetical protein